MRVFRVIAKSALTTLIFFFVVEIALRASYAGRNALVTYVPLPYVVGDDYGPIPPWLDNLLILRPDPVLIWKNIPDARRNYVDIFTPVWRDSDRIALLRRFLPWLPNEFRSNPVWRIALNDEGFRTASFNGPKRAGVLRVACIGDSWTFGMNVDQNQMYPARLEALLKAHPPADAKDVEVMNFGILGYTSFQGLQLFKSRVLDLHPDVVVIGFGMNDSDVAGYRDKDVLAVGPVRWRDRVKAVTARSESLALLKYVALTMRFHARNFGEFLNADAKTDQGKSNANVNYDELEPWTRVSPRDYDRNLREMIGLARAQGARVVLLDNELWEGSPYRPVLRTISRDEHVPLVDSLQLIADARSAVEREMETRFHLVRASSVGSSVATAASPQGVGTPVVFRVYEGRYDVPKQLSIVGNHPALGNFSPNTVPMHDDGASGDEHAGDHVWTFTATLPAGTRFRYVYTNSGAPGQWEGLDLPHIREVQVIAPPDGGPMYLPVETFGRLYMQADNWHTDAAGYELIAQSVAQALK
jgi:lysophospholipase L1-like esterase